MHSPAARETGHTAWVLLATLSAIPLVIHLAGLLSHDYTYFIDEFYYLACARRPALGYVDHPPLAPLTLAVTRVLLGDSLLGIRLLPFLASSVTIWITGILTRDLGGGWFATVVACVAFALAPVFLGMTDFFSMNAFEPLIWASIVLLLVRVANGANPRWWLLIGALVGMGFENKHTIVAYLLALAGAVLVTRYRRVVRDPWLWAGTAVALLIALPNIAWQVTNGWPALEFYRAAQQLKNLPSTPLQSIASQVMMLNPLALPIWLAGLLFLVWSARARSIRFLGVAFLFLLIIHVASGTSRGDRTLAAYPPLFAAGGVVFEGVLRRTSARAAVVAAIVITGLFLAPLVVPLLAPPTLARYAGFLGQNKSPERGKTSPLPQLLADRTGWPSFVDDMVAVYNRLPAEDRADAILFAGDYGHAGALELWGPARGLPPVICNHNTYYHWSIGKTDSRVLIAVGARRRDLVSVYRSVEQVGVTRAEYGMNWRSAMPILVARDPVVPLSTVWYRMRHYE